MGWEVDEVVPITCLLSNLWELLLRLLIMPCYASRRGLGECIHDRCEIVNQWFIQGGNLNTHLGGLRYLVIPGLPV